MKRLTVLDEDRRSIADFFERWGTLVGQVNFKNARGLYTDDVIAFGSLGKMLTSRSALETEQWRAVWPTLADYGHDLTTLHVIVSPDRLMAVGAVIARSRGVHKDGSHFERPVRVTASLMREALDAPWFMTHTHVSLTPGTPAPSYGNRPEAE